MNKPETPAERAERMRQWSISIQARIEMEQVLDETEGHGSRQPQPTSNRPVTVTSPTIQAVAITQKPIRLKIVFLIATILIVAISIGAMAIETATSGDPTSYFLSAVAAIFLFWSGYLISDKIFRNMR
ncbi:MAG: hypothetical protein WC250_00805 [Candidatus Paceibacterota bacterium]|jgi:hypothetical protein